MIDFSSLYRIRDDLNDAIKTEDLTCLAKIMSKENFNLNYIDKNGQSPLHMCCAVGNLDMIRILIDNGASINLINRDGFYPIHIASYYGFADIVGYLIDASIKFEAEFTESSCCSSLLELDTDCMSSNRQ
jgi:ankyrin repeat protein